MHLFYTLLYRRQDLQLEQEVKYIGSSITTTFHAKITTMKDVWLIEVSYSSLYFFYFFLFLGY